MPIIWYYYHLWLPNLYAFYQTFWIVMRILLKYARIKSSRGCTKLIEDVCSVFMPCHFGIDGENRILSGRNILHREYIRYISFLMSNIVNNQSSAFAKCWNLECYSAYHDCRHFQGSSEAFSIYVKIVLSQDLTVWKPQDLCSVWSYCSKIWHAPQWHWASERREILQYNILWFLSIIENRSDFIWLRNW